MERKQSNLTQALERAWRKMMETVPDLPKAKIVVGSGAGPTTYLADWPPEIFVPDEVLKFGPEATLGVLAHEAVHLIAFARDIKDTSNKSIYHNGYFGEIAKELGFVARRIREPYVGFVDLTTKGYRAQEAILSLLVPPPTETGLFIPKCSLQRIMRPGRAGSAATCRCAKPRTIRVAPSTLAIAAITCEACCQPFTFKSEAS